MPINGWKSGASYIKQKTSQNQGTHSFPHLFTLRIHILAPDNQTFDLSIEGSLTGPPPMHSFIFSLFCRYTRPSLQVPSIRVKPCSCPLIFGIISWRRLWEQLNRLLTFLEQKGSHTDQSRSWKELPMTGQALILP